MHSDLFRLYQQEIFEITTKDTKHPVWHTFNARLIIGGSLETVPYLTNR